MKRTLAMLAALLLCATQAPALADDTVAEESVILEGEGTAIDPAQAPALSDIAAANTSAALLSRHSSFAIYSLDYDYADGATTERESMNALINNGAGATLYSTNDALAFVYDGGARYLIYPDGRMGQNICFDDDINAYYDAQISSLSIYTHYEGETLESCTQYGDKYVITTSLSHGAYCDATGQSYDLDDDVPLVTTLTVDAATLEVTSKQLSAAVADGITVQLGNASAVLDAVELPEQYYAMADPAATRTITLIKNPASAAAEQTDVTIAEGAQPYVIPPDGYAVTVMKNEQFVEPADGDITSTGNLTLYLIPEA